MNEYKVLSAKTMFELIIENEVGWNEMKYFIILLFKYVNEGEDEMKRVS